MAEYSMFSQSSRGSPSTLSDGEPPLKRHAAGDIDRCWRERCPALTDLRANGRREVNLLPIDVTYSLVASYLTIPELVLIRRVSSSWLSLFSEACCWTNSCFEATDMQMQISNCVRVDAMPYLQALILTGHIYPVVTSAFIRTIFQQLAGGHNKALKRLISDVRVTPDVVAALPNLTQLVVTGKLSSSSDEMFPAARIIKQLPATLTSLSVPHTGPVAIEYTTAVTALIQHPMRQMKQLGCLYINSPQHLRWLLESHTGLTAIDIATTRSQHGATIVAELQLAAHLTDLSLRGFTCAAELIDTLCVLPIRRLTIEPSDVEVAFWEGLHKVRTSMISHLPAEQRHQQSQLVHLNVLKMYPTPHPDSLDEEWCIAALKASWCCNRFDVKCERMSMHGWQQVLAGTEGQRSELQYMSTQIYSLSAISRSFMMRHRSVTELTHFGNEQDNGTDIQLLAALPLLKTLNTARGYCTMSPAALRQGLSASGALTRLRQRRSWQKCPTTEAHYSCSSSYS